MSEMAVLLGVPTTFVFDEQEYKVVPRCFEVEAQMALHLEDRALRAVQRLADRLTQQEYRDQMDGLRRDAACDVYAYGTPEFVRYYSTVEGAKKAVFLQLSKHNKTVRPQLIERIYKDRKKWDELVELVRNANTDPTSQEEQGEAAAQGSASPESQQAQAAASAA